MQQLSLPSSSPARLRSDASKKRDSAIVAASLFKYLALALLFVLIAVGLQSTTGLRTIGAGFIFLLLLLLTWRVPLWGAVLTFAYLAILGGVRRWLLPDFGWPSYDPLILVGPGITLICFFQMVLSRQVPADTPLAKCMKWLLIIMAIQVVNPLQGGLLVGLGGVLYYIAPILWFYVGRRYGSLSILRQLYIAAIVIYCFGAFYGLKQVFFGLSVSEKQWMDVGGYIALNVSANAIRVFSTFASQQEFAHTLAYALCIAMAFILHRRFQFLLPLLILIPALLFTAAGGPIAFGLCAICIQWALLGHNRAIWLPRLSLALVIGVAGLVWSLSNIDTSSMSAGQADILTHQKEGLLDPGSSTAPGHISLVVQGIMFGFTHPLGAGLGATTIAAGKLAGGNEIEGFGAETDHGNLFISLGFVGGILYVVMTYLIFKQTINLWSRTREITYLIIVAVLVESFGQWLAGGLYSLCFITWYAVGVMDKQYSELKRSKEPVAATPVTERGRRFGRSNSLRRVLRPSRRRLPSHRAA